MKLSLFLTSFLIGCSSQSLPATPTLTKIELKDAFMQIMNPSGSNSNKHKEVVVWREPGDATIAESAEKKKMIMILLSQDWCGPCHSLIDMINRDEEVAFVINHNFIPVNINNASDDLVKEMTGREEVFYPMIIFINSDKEIKTTITGYGGKYDFIGALYSVLKLNEVRDEKENKVEKENSQAAL